MLGGKDLFILFIIIFLGGFISGFLVNDLNLSKPITELTIANSSNLRNLSAQSPKDRLSLDDIHLTKNRVTIEVEDAVIARFADTKSMEPVLSVTANAIEIIPKNMEDIKVGDIISYESKYAEGTIIHRVIEKGYDSRGLYFRTQGDNLKNRDPEKIRVYQIKRILVGIIY